MHTIHESNYTVIKTTTQWQESGEKDLIKNYQAQLVGWMHLMIFTHIKHSQTDARQRRTKNIFNIFQKGSFFGLDDCKFWECRTT